MRTLAAIKTLLVIILISGIFFLACEEDSNPVDVVKGNLMEAPEPGVLNAFPILGYMQSGAMLAPEIDNSKNEIIWDSAEPYEIQLEPDENGFAPTVSIRALYDNWYVYFLVEWDDSTKDDRPGYWWYGNPDPNGTTDIAIYDTIYTVWVTEDSSFKPQRRPVRRATGPQVWSRWNTSFDATIKTTTYLSKVTVSVDSIFTTTWDTVEVSYETIEFSGGEDGLALMWNVNTANFLNCSNLCHNNNQMSTDSDESADVWAWYAYRTNFRDHADDLALLHEGFVGDAGGTPFEDNVNSDANPPVPKWAYLHQPQQDTLVLYHLREVNFYPSLPWFSGNYIPGYKVNVPTGSRADVEASGTHEDNGWFLEMRRSLQTDDITKTIDKTDIQFNPSADADMSFHLVVYNNNQGKRHAYTGSVHTLHFIQLLKEEK
ncbi:hypothetical protein JW964_18110 [candidate division KSB1 bacterium]|nr:hypothetical protein [candidate division KSB1 bacterium]